MNGLRLHVGTGCTYLLPDIDGPWVNVDVWQSGAALASDCPAGIKKWGTYENDYYAKVSHIDAAYLGLETPDHEGIVCDAYGSWTNLPFDDESAIEILSRQCFEHLSKTESRYALAEARRVLKVGGILRLDVPDHEAALREHARLLKDAELESNVPLKIEKKRTAAFMLRHLLGSRKNDWAWHMGSWTRQKLIDFCGQYGFKHVADEENIHFYPAFCLKFQKQPTCDFPELDAMEHPWKAAWEYCGQPRGALEVPASYKVLEVGPGTAPWARANYFCDIVTRDLPNFMLCDVHKLPYKDKEFDYLFCAHCLEHVAEPLLAASEISRVAKAGCIVCPSEGKDTLMLFHEQDHRWTVKKWQDELHFYRIQQAGGRPKWETLYNQQLSGEMHRLFRYGERRLEGLCNEFKRWFHHSEPFLDEILHWEGELKVRVFN